MTIETAIDPVCGMTVDETEALEHELGTTFEGREYVFCGPGCKRRFLAQPTLYAAVGRAAP